MTAANQQDPKKTGDGDEGIARQLEALDIKDLAGEGHDSVTGDKAGGVARRINDYCDKAVTHIKAGRLEKAYRYADKAHQLKALDIKDQAGAGHDSATGDKAGEVVRCVKDYCDKAVEYLKAGRLEEAYRDATEAVELDGKDAKAAALHRYTFYALEPVMRLHDKAEALREEAHQCLKDGDYDRARELRTLAKKWRCTSLILWLRLAANYKRGCFDLAYLDVTEALAEVENTTALSWLADIQMSCLQSLGFKVPQVIEPEQQRVDEMHAQLPLNDRPVEFEVDVFE